MSCVECSKIQELNKQGQSEAYMRVGAANVLIGACDKHFNELRQMMGKDVQLDAPICRVVMPGNILFEDDPLTRVKVGG